TKAIQLDPNWVDNVNIKLPEPLTEAGVYTVEVPAGMFIVKGLSAAIEWSFTIQAEVTAEISMADGLTYPFAAFANFVMTYPEGTTIEVNPGKTAVLENFKLGQTVKISDYEAVVDKNVVTLKAKDMSKMPVANNKNTNYMKIDVPAGLFTITSNGSSYENPAKVYEKFLSTAYADSDFQFIPAIGSDVTVDQLKEITFLIPEGSVYCGGKLATTTVLTVVPNNSGNTNYKYEYKFKSISEDGRQVVAVLNESETGLANNLAYFQKGEAYIKVAANFIQVEGTTNKNGAVAVKAYNVTDGITTAPIYESSPNDGAAESSISSFSLKFPCNVVVNTENAEITLSMDGKLVKTVKAGETTTAAAKADGAGANTVAYSNIFKDEDGNNFTTPGVYTFNVPADAYKQVGQDYLSTDYEATVYIVRNVDFEIYPKPATFSGTAKELIVTPGTEFTELTSFTLTYAENTTVELTEDWKSALYNAAIGKVGASALLKDPIVSVPTNQSGYAMNRVEVDGNKVTIYLNMPYNIATPANYGLGIKIPKGVFIVNVPNEDGTVTKCANDQILEYYQGVPMAAGRLGVVSLGANGAAEAQYINAENNFIMSSELNELVYTAYETLYPAKTTPKAELRDEDGNLIATYSGAAVDADKLPGMSAASIAFTPDAEYSEAIAGIKTSTVKFVVLEHTLQGGSATSATTMVFNTSDFTYELNVLETTMTPSVETGGSVAELSNIEFSFSDVLAIAVNEEVVPVVTYVDTYTEGAMSGEKYNRSIAEDGYKVELQASGIPEEEAIAEGDDDFGTKGNVARLVITPALTKEDTYTIHIPAGALLLNGVVKSAAIDMTVKVEAPKDVEFEDYIVKQTPAGDEITIGDTFYKMGMGNIVVTAKDGAVLNKDCKEKAQLQCLIPSLGMEEPMVVGTASVEDINDMGEMENPNPFAEGDEEGDAEGETKAGTNYILTFQLEDENMQQLLIQPGIWMVNIPVGMFTVNGANVKEGTLQYNLAAVSKDYTWTINPENGTEFEDAISGDIVLTIEGAEEVSYDDAPATLIGPDGNKVIGFGSSPALGTNT
ncbi:MAG: hypothetical protein K2I91_04205, partial [Muribaculaceae bacterium]|nr:hypothetical protein [Muribaculaceae bacterium]